MYFQVSRGVFKVRAGCWAMRVDGVPQIVMSRPVASVQITTSQAGGIVWLLGLTALTQPLTSLEEEPGLSLKQAF